MTTKYERLSSLDLNDYSRIIVLTGAGISTGCGVLPYRAPGGILDQIKSLWGDKYERLKEDPILALSRVFHNTYPEFADEFWKWFRDHFGKLKPGPVHTLCKKLNDMGKLVRVYTQNVDGLHDHKSLGPEIADKVVNFHGRLETIVLYGDPIPSTAYDTILDDFEQADLVLTIGTSLQVLPFSAIPNLTPIGAVRGLICKPLADCFSGGRANAGHLKLQGANGTRFVTTRNLWRTRESGKQWPEFYHDGDCDALALEWIAQLS